MPNLALYNPDVNNDIIQNTSGIIIPENQIVQINNELRNGNQVIVSNIGTWHVITNNTTAIYPNTSATTASTGIYYSNNNIHTTSTANTSITSTAGFYYWPSYGSNYVNNNNYWEPPKPKRGPLIKKSIKSSIKRALKLMSNFGMEEDVRIFLGGDDIEVSHPDSLFKFVISKKPNSILRYTEHCGHHTPYNLSLYTKSDIFVADLCVYFEQTPIFDQILAISMFIKCGDEDLLLNKANWNSLTDNKEITFLLAETSPMIKDKLRLNRFNN